ncbi:hypothetical protein C2845_PM02G14110 [Panicum miliaceum]|uniref:Acetyltransferase n=1 Tax=Panicum miliaceum TaxID=4540 RepID=A0A3L6SG46_PANMI|nr:hypothetical protein C2845_PM02G14110 [Panicum miliaceum]
MPSPAVSVPSRRTVRPPPWPRVRIQLISSDLTLLPADYLQYSLLFAPPPVSTAQLVDHLATALADVLAIYYPVSGRLDTEQHRDDKGQLTHRSCWPAGTGGWRWPWGAWCPRTDTAIHAHVAAWTAKPALVSALRPLHRNGMVIAGSPRFDVYGCDFEWGKPLAVRTGKVSLFPRRDGGGGIDVEVALAPEHMAALELDGEFWAAVSPNTRRNVKTTDNLRRLE